MKDLMLLIGNSRDPFWAGNIALERSQWTTKQSLQLSSRHCPRGAGTRPKRSIAEQTRFNYEREPEH